MLITEIKPIQRKARGPTRFAGICRDAKKLGVTYPHLWAVLTGRRVSPLLVRRYMKLHPEFSAERKVA